MRFIKASMVEKKDPDGYHLVLRTGPYDGVLDSSLTLTAYRIDPISYNLCLVGKVAGVGSFDGKPQRVEDHVLDDFVNSLRRLHRYPPSVVMVQHEEHVTDDGDRFDIAIGPPIRPVLRRPIVSGYVPNSSEEIGVLVWGIKREKNAPFW
ncbi:MAG: hypothetical protein GF368_00290 [Candidatus Aenigmarchaeota archaeon]|nr:hypothetical protein [Candidatus Aenigmarchaeota archaeon]